MTTNVLVGNLTQANLIHNGDASLLAGLVELHHGGGDVAGGDDMLLLTDGRLNDGGVEGIRDQADDEVMLGNLSIQSLVISDVQGDGSGTLCASNERLGGLESSAGYSHGK